MKITTGNNLVIAAAMVSIVGLAPNHAPAADLGGDCCADLEERVVELEQTTVRKGNRKVSLQLSGHINHAIMIWDDGRETNAYVVDNDFSGGRFRLRGSAPITSDVSAGYYMEFQINGIGNSGDVNQNNDNAGRTGPNVRHSMMYLKSATYGKLSIGQTSPAVDDLTQYGGYLPWAEADAFVGGGMLLRRADTGALTGVTLKGVFTGFDESRRNIVRYDTPTFAGFTVATAWGEDDYWDVALRYAGELGQFKVHAAVGYNNDRDEGTATGTFLDDEAVKAYGGIQHKPTGLFIVGSYTDERHNGTTTELDETGYLIGGGIDQRWSSLGKTRIWGTYVHSEGDGTGTGNFATSLGGTFVTDTDVDRWNVGVTQWVDAAALELYAFYTHYDIGVDVDGAAVPLEDMQFVTMGGRIKF